MNPAQLFYILLMNVFRLFPDCYVTGKVHGADDFLPVLMYVLARCNISALLLDVEYMMELMDPALQLGEGEDTHTHAYTSHGCDHVYNGVIAYFKEKLRPFSTTS